MKKEEVDASNKFQQYIKMDSWQQLLLNLTVFSLIPAFCEEVFFRGTMQPLWYKCLPKPWLAVFITAFLFSLLHFQFQGFLPRFLAGVVFGGIFYLSGSLWLSISSHILYNSSVVLLNYANQHSQVNIISLGKILLNPLLLIVAALGMAILFFQMYQGRYKKYYYNK
ncbi:CPBP family intramembrane glutamic endopeptidase [Adhaeribacter radiodurans]|uniref:CPBP family intramembrane metalloprotease n=1 Tax=Adhaeribacter radiodurans TaxID=2745197 RepID=A0A7L7LAT6_9BACT|nr:CPBP family intramembrane glutamic endopeptidase [Adhaeribacter radiodurans]QMU29948.1 CPBP family intramembrane metalloprotease [Adhaeribacter radiodurans]